MTRSQDAGSSDAVTIVAHDVGGVGGMERQLQALIAGLLDHGVEVTVVSRTLGLPEHACLRWRRVLGPSRPFALAYPWFAVMATAMLTSKRRGPLHTTGAIVLNRAEICTVHYVHARERLASSRARRITVLYRLNEAVARKMSVAGERVVYSSPSLAGQLVAVSDQLASDLRLAFPKRSTAISVIPNGVDSNRFRPDEDARRDVRHELGIEEEIRLALFVGSEWRGKGVDIAIRALPLAPSWQLAVVGQGDAEEMARLAKQLGVRARVHLVAESLQPERYYAAADAFVLPSSYESFSLAAFEAAASGLPLLTTRVGAVGEIINAGGGAFIERNPSSVAASLRGLEADPERFAAMSKQAREAARRFDWADVTEKYLDLYRPVRRLRRSHRSRAAAQ